MALLPGASWNTGDVKDGEWVVAHGQPEAGTAPAAGCPAHGYTVTALQANPNAPVYHRASGPEPGTCLLPPYMLREPDKTG